MKYASLLLLPLVFFPACKQNSVVIYRAPKDVMPSATSAAVDAEHVHRDFDWTVPVGWTERAPTNMRVGSFSAPGNVDVSIISLSGDAGGDLANVNRWRDQIGLTPLDEAGLSKQNQAIRPAGREMKIIDFSNAGKRVIAASLFDGKKTWFFKMTGAAADVGHARASFIKLLESLKTHAHD